MNTDWIRLHLVLNHIPVVLALVGALACVAALIGKREGLWRYAAVTVLLAGLSAPLALLTGQRAEDGAEELWYVSHAAVHEHEEAGEKAMWITVVAGVLALAALRWRARWARFSMAVLAIVAAGAMGYAAFEGGKIVHDSPKLESAPPVDGVRP